MYICVALPGDRSDGSIVTQIYEVLDMQPLVLDIKGMGPNAAVQFMEEQIPVGEFARKQWLRYAKISAILGSCPKSRESFKSGETSQSLAVHVV